MTQKQSTFVATSRDKGDKNVASKETPTDEDDLDGCDVPITDEDATPDDDLPVAS